jgi:SAM-dependent methyltransferase
MNAAASPIPCNLCGSVDVDELSLRDRDGHPLRTTICRACGLVWSNPRPSEEEVRLYYSREYRLDYKGHVTPSLRHIARSGRGAMNRCRDLAPFLKRGDRLLDAGAGGGEVVYVLRKLGYDAMGLEPDERYASHARETLGVPVETGFVQDRAFPAGRFDVITMYHALEHVEDPVGILATLRGWLCPTWKRAASTRGTDSISRISTISIGPRWKRPAGKPGLSRFRPPRPAMAATL